MRRRGRQTLSGVPRRRRLRSSEGRCLPGHRRADLLPSPGPQQAPPVDVPPVRGVRCPQTLAPSTQEGRHQIPAGRVRRHAPIDMAILQNVFHRISCARINRRNRRNRPCMAETNRPIGTLRLSLSCWAAPRAPAGVAAWGWPTALLNLLLRPTRCYMGCCY
jgi:hypothetical protein